MCAPVQENRWKGGGKFGSYRRRVRVVCHAAAATRAEGAKVVTMLMDLGFTRYVPTEV